MAYKDKWMALSHYYNVSYLPPGPSKYSAWILRTHYSEIEFSEPSNYCEINFWGTS